MTESYPELIDLIGRLFNSKDKKTCELALYVLRRQDARIATLQNENETLKKALKSMLTDVRPNGSVDVANRYRFADPVWEVKARTAIREGGGND